MGDGEITQWLRTPAALEEDLGSVSSPYMVHHNHFQLQLQGHRCAFFTSVETAHK